MKVRCLSSSLLSASLVLVASWTATSSALSETCNASLDDDCEEASLLQATRRDREGTPPIAVCGNYMGPDFCNGKVGQHESTCFPLKHTNHPFKDRASPRDCADACAQKHDYCCHNRVGECDGCIKSPWADDCNTHLWNCIRDCSVQQAMALRVEKLQGSARAAKGRCGQCHQDALLNLYRGASSKGKSCVAGLLKASKVFLDVSFLTKIDRCRLEDNPWSIRFASFHTHRVKISMRSGQSGCHQGTRYFSDQIAARNSGDRSLYLAPGEAMSLTSRLQDVLWYGETCTFSVFDADSGQALLDVDVWFSTDGILENHRLACTSKSTHRQKHQNAGAYLDVGDGDGGDGEFNNPGCIVCLCSHNKGCDKRCANRKEPSDILPL